MVGGMYIYRHQEGKEMVGEEKARGWYDGQGGVTNVLLGLDERLARSLRSLGREVR